MQRHRISARIPAFALACLCAAPAPRAAEDYSAWAHAARIHLNTSPTGADLSNPVADFPLLVRIDDERVFSQSLADGADLRFASETGVPLDFQIERWSPSLGKAEVWVRMPEVSAASATQWIRAYWGKPGAAKAGDGGKVFARTGGFHAVYHFGETGTQARSNAAGAGNAAPKNYDGDERVEGIIGWADSLDGVSPDGDYLDLGTGYDSLSSFSFTVWAYVARAGFVEKILDLGNGLGADEFAFGRPGPGDSLAGLFFRGPAMNRASVGAAGALAIGKWSLYGITAAGRNVSVYKDGAAIASGTLPQEMAGAARRLNFIGHSNYPGGGDFAGKLDEARFSYAARSPDWMKLAYASQRPGAGMLTWEFESEIALKITKQPEGRAVDEGSAFSLSVAAAGAGPLAYQWLKDGKPLPGAVGAELRIAAATLADAGIYACRVTDGADSLLSQAATVRVPEDFSTWAHAQAIDVDARRAGISAGGDIGAIPLLIRLGRGASVLAQAAPGGRDLRFAAHAGTPLAYAIERWTPDTAEIWVRLEGVPQSGTLPLTLYWGKSAAPAASSPAAVFTVNDAWRAYYACADSSGAANPILGDATLNGFAAAGSGLTFSAASAIGRGIVFRGAADSHLLVPAAAVEGLQAFTVLAWVREKTPGLPGPAPAQDPQILGTGLTAFGTRQFGLASRNGALEGWVAGSPAPSYPSRTGSARLDDGHWHMVAVSSAGTEFTVFADGESEFGLAAPDLALPGAGLGLGGARGGGGNWSAPFDGEVDAVQILGEAKSADWIGLAYASQRPGGELVRLGEAADQAPPAPVIDPPGGTLAASAAVSLTCPSDGARIFYTLDGSAPDTAARESTRLYAAPFALPGDASVRALAYRRGRASPVASASFRVAGIPEAGDTLGPGESAAVDGLRRVVYPGSAGSAKVRLLPGPAWNPEPKGFDRVGPLFQVRAIEASKPFPVLALEGDSLEGLALYRRDPNLRTLWMEPVQGKPVFPGPGDYFWGRDTLPPRIRLTGSSFRGSDSVAVRVRIEDNVTGLTSRMRFGKGGADSVDWGLAGSGDTLEFMAPVPADPGQPLEVSFVVSDHAGETALPPKGLLTLPRPVPSVAAPVALKPGYKWRLAGMPILPGTPLTLRELADRSGLADLAAAVWRGETPPDSGYRILREDDTLPRGQGFWLSSAGQAMSLNFPPGLASASDSDGLFAIRLHKGWNLVACPALRPLAWPVSIRDGDAALGSALKPLYAYTETGYVRPDSLRPWEAYYVKYAKDTVVRVGQDTPRAAVLPAAKVSAGTRLRLDLAAGGIRIALGAAPLARDGLGVEDDALPPSPGQERAFWLSRESRALAVDYVAWNPEGVMAWTVEAHRQPAGTEVAIPTAALPQGLEAWAVSPARRLKWRLLPGGGLPLSGDDTLLVYAGVPSALARVSALARGRLAAGPFSACLRADAGGLILTLDLPGDALVRARFWDIRGKIRGGFGDRALASGRHVLPWPALSPGRDLLPRGAYWLELRVRGEGWSRREVHPVSLLR